MHPCAYYALKCTLPLHAHDHGKAIDEINGKALCWCQLNLISCVFERVTVAIVLALM